MFDEFAVVAERVIVCLQGELCVYIPDDARVSCDVQVMHERSVVHFAVRFERSARGGYEGEQACHQRKDLRISRSQNGVLHADP